MYSTSVRSLPVKSGLTPVMPAIGTVTPEVFSTIPPFTATNEFVPNRCVVSVLFEKLTESAIRTTCDVIVTSCQPVSFRLYWSGSVRLFSLPPAISVISNRNRNGSSVFCVQLLFFDVIGVDVDSSPSSLSPWNAVWSSSGSPPGQQIGINAPR